MLLADVPTDDKVYLLAENNTHKHEHCFRGCIEEYRTSERKLSRVNFRVNTIYYATTKTQYSIHSVFWGSITSTAIDYSNSIELFQQNE